MLKFKLTSLLGQVMLVTALSTKSVTVSPLPTTSTPLSQQYSAGTDKIVIVTTTPPAGFPLNETASIVELSTSISFTTTTTHDRNTKSTFNSLAEASNIMILGTPPVTVFAACHAAGLFTGHAQYLVELECLGAPYSYANSFPWTTAASKASIESSLLWRKFKGAGLGLLFVLGIALIL